MNNVLEKIICVEVIEKIVRLKMYLQSDNDRVSTHERNVVGVFNNSINAIVDYMKPIIGAFAQNHTMNEWEKRAIIRSLSDVYRYIYMLHMQLQFVYGKWVRPETRIFLKNTLEFLPLERRKGKNVNIILSYVYSFSEIDLTEYVERILIQTKLKSDECPSIFLPKIERENPLNWAILVHECGHVDSIGIKRSSRRDSFFDDRNATDEEKERMYNWIEEIYCDIFATRILGPAYLASYATYVLLSAGLGGSERASRTHPPDIVRIAIINEVLQKYNLDVGIRTGYCKYSSLKEMFYSLIEGRAKIERAARLMGGKEGVPSADGEKVDIASGKYLDSLCESVDRCIFLSRNVSIENFSRVAMLSESLRRGIVIGSYKNVEVLNAMKEKYSSGGIDATNIFEAIEGIRESRVLLWEIMNAGWVNKVENLYPSAFKWFFTKSNIPIQKRIDQWAREICSSDRILLKSIETSEIHRIYEKDDLRI